MSDLVFHVIEGTPRTPEHFCGVCGKPNCNTLQHGQWACSDECCELIIRGQAKQAITSSPHGVQLRRSAGWRKPANTVVVTRASKKWGNPFIIGKDSIYGFVTDAKTAVDFYRRWLKTTPEGASVLREARKLLPRQNLACFCPLDSPCHRNVLLDLVNSTQRP
jgi:ribosomal protein L37AE/L43A